MAPEPDAFDPALFFRTLVGHFYDRVAVDAVLRPMYPADLAPASERLALFLLQYFTDDRSYEALRGEPRLRMRHQRFRIDQAARDAWVENMNAALAETVADGLDPGPEDLEVIGAYFAKTATFLINTGGLTIVGR
jgi:hemoglobin